MSPATGDKRFADPAFADNPLYFLLAQQYLLAGQLVAELLDAAGLDAKQETKARFAAKFMLDALAPTNTLPGNPAALRHAFDTGGKSVVRGAKNMIDDLRHNGGWPSQVDSTGFEVGVNMAATPGSVVYRSELIELIQYEPQVKRVHSVPLLFCPPWINKYYIMDLAPGKSLIEWAVQHGHTCFAISYRNPDASMRDAGVRGLPATRPVGCRTRRAGDHRRAGGQHPVRLPRRHVDGDRAGVQRGHRRSVDQVGHFPQHPHRLQRARVRSAYSPTRPRSSGSRSRWPRRATSTPTRWRTPSMRCGPTTWCSRYVVNNWLLGKKPPAFDLLVWNKDSTRMPAKMHSRYLRSCYLNNEFARGEFEVDGVKLDPEKIDIDTYVLLPSTTTSCRGSRATRPPNCSAGTTASCSAPPATSPASSTRPAPSPSTGPTTHCLPIRRSGRTTPCSRTAPGGRTGPRGSQSVAAPRSLHRAGWEATSTHRSRPHPGSYVRTRA